MKNQVDIKNFFDLPCHVYIKDSNGIYKECNDQQARTIGLSKGTELVGLTDNDTCCREFTESYRANEAVVFATEKMVTAIEHGTTITNTRLSTLSFKMPYYGHSGKMIATMGLSFLLDNAGNSIMIEPFKMVGAMNLLWQHEIIHSADVNLHDLTQKEKMILQYTLKGLTAKRIAARLNLSPRTIEHHLEKIKLKTGTTSKSQLIEEFLQHLT